MAEERVQRRLAAILAADVVGYSRLMSEDEAGTLAQLKAHRKELLEPKITEHGGHIVKLMGDGVLVEFPSVVEAVQCAVEVQNGMAVRNASVPDDRRITFRIGVNLGDVIVEGDDIYGDGVNVAARLEGVTAPRSRYRLSALETTFWATTRTSRAAGAMPARARPSIRIAARSSPGSTRGRSGIAVRVSAGAGMGPVPWYQLSLTGGSESSPVIRMPAPSTL